MTAMNTMPAASETWITDIGASDSAATCRPQLAVAMIMPSVNHLEEYSCLTERSGCSTCTFGTEFAPLYLKKKPRFATKAHASARSMPRSMFMVWGATDGSSAGGTDCFTAPGQTQRIVRLQRIARLRQRTW